MKPYRLKILNIILLLTPVVFVLPVQANTLSLAGVVKADQTAILSSLLDGLIKQVHVNAGDNFSLGDTLLSIDCTLHEAIKSKAQAEVEVARNEYLSARDLEKLNSSTKVEVARAAANFAKAKAELDIADHKVGQCNIVAPFDGTVVQTWARNHETINAKTKLLEIVNNNQLVAEFLAPSNAVKTIATGVPFSFTVAETGKTYTAHIDKIIPFVDSVSQTIKVIGRLDDQDNNLWAGMSGLVRLQD